MFPWRTTARRTAATGSTAAIPAAKMCRLSSRSCWTVRDIFSRLHSRGREEHTLHRLEVLQTLEGIGATATLSLFPFGQHIRGHRVAHQPAGILPIGGQMRIDPVRDILQGGGPMRQCRRTLLQAWHEVLDEIEPLIERYQARDAQRVVWQVDVNERQHLARKCISNALRHRVSVRFTACERLPPGLPPYRRRRDFNVHFIFRLSARWTYQNAGAICKPEDQHIP